MKWLWVFLIALSLSSVGLTQEQIKRVTFYCEPGDAQVFLEISGTAPYLLGDCNRPLPLDLTLFDGRRSLSVTFRRPGWMDETRVLQQPGVEGRYFANRDRYPDASQGPVHLTPRSDLKSRGLQALYYLHSAGLPLAGLMALGGFLYWRSRQRLAVLQQGHARAQTLDKMRAGAEGPDPLLMTVLGGYRLVERIGCGGMASVYRGLPDASLERQEEVAVKVMHPQFAADSVNRQRFRREIEIYRDLKHRNLLRLDDFGEQDGILYLVVELLRGNTLRQILRGRKLSLREVLQYAEPLAETMDFAHQKQIIHRDLKPDNIFLTEEGRLVVMDFGIARGGDYTQATATGQGLGTPEYMAPEQVQGRPESASDLYSFGVMLFEMFSGTLPFQGDDPMAIAFLHVGQQPPSLAALRPDLPPQVAATVARLLAKDPKKRFASFGEALEALR